MQEIIRPLQNRDIPAVVSIARSAMSHPWSEAVFRDSLKTDYYSWVLTQGDDLLGDVIVGFVVVLVQIGECQLLNICVHSKFQHQGFGRTLLNYVIDFAKVERLARITLEVRCSNQFAIALYHALGFKQSGIRKNYYPSDDGREDAIIFKLPLSPPPDMNKKRNL